MKRLVPLLFTVIVACKTPTFEAERELFYKEANERGCLVAPVSIYFARLDSGTAGYCVKDFGILLNETMWMTMKEYQRRELVFHELGHCVLGYDHQDLGIMTTKMHSEAEMEIMWDKYLDLFFKDCLTLTKLLVPNNEKEPL